MIQMTLPETQEDLQRFNEGMEVPYPYTVIAQRAFEILGDILKAHGTDFTKGSPQWSVLRHLIVLYFKLITGTEDLRKTQRVVAPLPTGWGKTTSVVATIAAIHECSNDQSIPGLAEAAQECSLLVAAERIESLIEVKQSLEGLCGPEVLPKIGLVHSKLYDPEKARAFQEMGTQLPRTHASEPAVVENPDDRQFMLLSHAKIKNSAAESVEQYLTYRGVRRSLSVWDESLLPADVYSLDAFDFDTGAYSLGKRRAQLPEQFSKWLEKTNRLFNKIPEDLKQGRTVNIPPLPTDIIEHQLQTLNDDRDKNIEAVKRALELAGSPVRFHPASRGMIASYEPNLSSELSPLVILDASYVVREAAKIDQRVRAVYTLPGKFKRNLQRYFIDKTTGLVASPKSYRRLKVKLMDGPWGRKSIAKELDLVRDYSKRRLLNDVVKAVKEIPGDEGLLIFTFKDRGNSRPVEKLQEALEDAGVDLGATVETPEGPRPRINISTWGMETSTNRFAYCQHVMLLGVLQLPAHEHLGRHLAGYDNLDQEYTEAQARRMSHTESAHKVYQAASRGACRMSDPKGNAKGMTLWITCGMDHMGFKQHLSKVFPKATYEDWSGEYSDKRDTGKTKTAKRTILACLESLEEEGVTEISSRKLKERFPEELGSIPTTTFRDAVAALKERPETAWMVSGRSFERVDWGED
jgi:hypothetical protein